MNSPSSSEDDELSPWFSVWIFLVVMLRLLNFGAGASSSLELPESLAEASSSERSWSVP